MSDFFGVLIVAVAVVELLLIGILSATPQGRGVFRRWWATQGIVPKILLFVVGATGLYIIIIASLIYRAIGSSN